MHKKMDALSLCMDLLINVFLSELILPTHVCSNTMQPEAASSAIAALNGCPLAGRMLKVRMASALVNPDVAQRQLWGSAGLSLG